MEALQAKAKYTDERIEQLKALAAKIGPVDPQIYIQGLEEENARLKARVESLVKELVQLENQRGIQQQYDFANKVPKAPTSTAPPAAAVPKPTPTAAAEASATASAPAPAEGGKEKKKAAKPAAEKPAATKAIDISRLDLRVGKILSVEKHPDADSLYVEQIDVGEEKPRTVCSGLVKHMQPSDLDQKLVIVLCNLKPAKMRGVNSEAMVMCASTPDKVELLEPPADAKPGDRVQCEGYDCSSPDAQVKKDLSDQILPMMKTNEKGEATFNGTVWSLSNGKGLIKAKSLVDVPIK